MLSDRRAHSGPDTEEQPPEEWLELAPGTEQRYTQDLSSLFNAPPAAGDYEVTALLVVDGTLAQSSAAMLTLAPPSAAALAHIVTRDERSIVTLLARQEDGVQTLFQRESLSQNPARGTAYTRGQLSGGGALSGVATSVEVAQQDQQGEHWYAWLQGDQLGAGVGGMASYFALPPVDLGLSAAALHPVGWQVMVSTARFAVLGRDAGGSKLVVASTWVRGATGTIDLKPTRLALPPDIIWWAAQCDPASGAVELVAWVHNGGRLELLRQRVLPDHGRAEPVVRLIARDEPLVALALAPVAGQQPGEVDVLFGPTGSEGRMTLLRLPLGGGEPVGRWRFLAPRAPDGRLPGRWALGRRPHPQPVVLARVGDQIQARGAGDWFVVDADARGAEQLWLDTVLIQRPEYWASWVDRHAGLTFRPLSKRALK